MANYTEWDRLVNLFRPASKSPNIAKAFDEAKKHSVRQDAELTALTAAVAGCQPAPGPGSSSHLTGTHWPNDNEYSTLAGIGYDFGITNVSPTDTAGATAKLNAAQAAGMKLIIGIYHFGGPHPYTLSNGVWTISANAQTMLNHLESRESDIIALFVYNEPYWLNPFTEASDACGAMSAADLRSLRTKIKTVWPTAKIYHDIGLPSAWTTGGAVWQSCVGTKYDDQTGVADYVGYWYYPFRSTYLRTEGLATLQTETNYIVNSMGAIPVFLGQAHSGVEGLTWPSNANLSDWNQSIRAVLPSQSLISWYVWRQTIYPDYLVNHPTQWSLTVA